MNEVRAFLGLGSNLGDREENLRRAVELLGAAGRIRVVRTSSLYETDPVGPPQPDYLNAVVGGRPRPGRPASCSTPRWTVERELGRVRDERWGPRTVDVDVLTYGDESIDEPGLTVPHPRMRERAFVLVPLRELDPDAAGEPAAEDGGVRWFGPPIVTVGDEGDRGRRP